MILKDITLCSTHLDFDPVLKWPHELPPMAWGLWLIAGFKHDKAEFALSQDVCLLTLVKACYPKPSWAEVGRLINRLQSLIASNPNFRTDLRKGNFISDQSPLAVEEKLFQTLFQIYDFKTPYSRCRDVLEHLTLLPKSYQDWTSRKELGLRDLEIFRGLGKYFLLPHISNALEKLASFNPSRGDGVLATELICQLAATETTIVPDSENGTPEINGKAQNHPEALQNWIKDLHKRRFPKTSSRDSARVHSLHKIPWPPHIKTSWQRYGDAAELHIQFSAIDPDDFEKKTKSLWALSSQIKTEVWSKSNL